jgi:hypothetical protein
MIHRISTNRWKRLCLSALGNDGALVMLAVFLRKVPVQTRRGDAELARSQADTQ